MALTSSSERLSRVRGRVSAAQLGRMAAAELPALPVFAALGLIILWSAHDGGYDEDTWYWGALVVLTLLVASFGASRLKRRRLRRSLKVALIVFGLYVAWSYLSITWASSPGDALTGSNRALLYLLLFTLFAIAPWTPARALAILVLYAIGVGIIGLLILIAMAKGHHSASLFDTGRLSSPTGYINATAALFTSAAFVAIALAVRRELPSLLRGLLVAISCGGMQLALLTESRGWLFTLPFILAAAVAVVPARLRTAAAAILPAAGALVVLPHVLDVFKSIQGTNPSPSALVTAAEHAARSGLLACAVVLCAGTLLAMLDRRVVPKPLSRGYRLLIGTVASILAVAALVAAGLIGTNGHPISFIKRQLNSGPTELLPNHAISHFAVAGTGRFDIWRVALDAALAHPVGGLGQDNFVDYYLPRRHTAEEPRYTHSIELRFLAHTGFVGFGLAVAFFVAAMTVAIGNRRRGGPARGAAGIALLPLFVWLIHGSVDWFWEMPALSGPALGFLAMSTALTPSGPSEPGTAPARRRIPRGVSLPVAAIALIAAVIVLGFPYLSVREVSTATDIQTANPVAALNDFSEAARLDPLNADPGRLGGAVALQIGLFTEAEKRFDQSIAREPGGWFSWLGAGLAASSLGDAARARDDFAVAESINSSEPVIAEALARVDSRTPLTASDALNQLIAGN